ncbi:MAG TPA: GNAT family N-acetyltransferase [Deltaproteobacteria bacterium]|nr:GNAT family N-acetyltransferase [Deltaproteobacteria bacterium]
MFLHEMEDPPSLATLFTRSNSRRVRLEARSRCRRGASAMGMPAGGGNQRQAVPIQPEATRLPSPRADLSRCRERPGFQGSGAFIPESAEAGSFRLSDRARSLRDRMRAFGDGAGTELALKSTAGANARLPSSTRRMVPMIHPATRVTPLPTSEPRKGASTPRTSARSDAGRMRVGFGSPAERRDILEWLEHGLRPGRAGRLAREYPILFRRNPSVFPITLFDGAEPAAFAMLWAVHVRVGVHRLRVGLVSLVYTDPALRGRGYGRRVVEAAMAQAEGLQLGLVVLWSELESFYSPLGFVRAGREDLLVLDIDSIDSAIREVGLDSPAATFTIGSLEDPDWSAIERIRSQRECQIEMNPDEFRSLRSIPDMHVRVARDATGVRGFAIRGRGDDFREVIHEWGGSPAATLECCRSLAEALGPEREILLLGPPGRSAVPWALRRNGARLIRKPLGWARLASLEALSEDLAAFLPGSAGIRLFRMDPSPAGEIRVTSDRGTARVSSRTLLHLLLGSDEPTDGMNASELRSLLAPALAPSALEPLPLPFFIWGLESI